MQQFLRGNSKYFAIEVFCHPRHGGRGAIKGESLTVARVKYRLDVMMHSASNGAQAIDDNFFQHLHSIHKCAIKYVNKYFFFYGMGSAINGLRLYFMWGADPDFLHPSPAACTFPLLGLPALCCAVSSPNAPHGCIINYAYQNSER